MGQVLYAHFRRPKLDPWLTVSGWLWMLYLVGLAAAAILFARSA